TINIQSYANLALVLFKHAIGQRRASGIVIIKGPTAVVGENAILKHRRTIAIQHRNCVRRARQNKPVERRTGIALSIKDQRGQTLATTGKLASKNRWMQMPITLRT